MQKVYTIRPSSLFYFLFRIFLFLLLMNFVGIAVDYYFTQSNRSSYLLDTYLIKLFYFDGEKNIPSYFSTIIFLLCAALLFIISKVDKTRFNKRWFYLAFIFIFLSLDELISIHEVLTAPSRIIMQKLVGSQELGVLYYAWIVPYLLLLLVAAVYFYKFVFSLPKKILFNFLVAGAIFIAGAVGMEMVGGFVAEQYGMTGLSFKISSTIEESLEMIGIIYFARILMQYLEIQPERTELIFNLNNGSNEKNLETHDYQTFSTKRVIN